MNQGSSEVEINTVKEMCIGCRLQNIPLSHFRGVPLCINCERVVKNFHFASKESILPSVENPIPESLSSNKAEIQRAQQKLTQNRFQEEWNAALQMWESVGKAVSQSAAQKVDDEFLSKGTSL